MLYFESNWVNGPRPPDRNLYRAGATESVSAQDKDGLSDSSQTELVLFYCILLRVWFRETEHILEDSSLN